MAGSPFKLKEIIKEKEAALPDKLPMSDKLPTKDKHEKEKSEAEKAPKDTKDHKDQKESKDKQEKEKHEKESKNESKEHADKLKLEKEVRDHKGNLPKEHLPKETIKDAALEKLLETKPAANEAGLPSAPEPEEATAASFGAQKIVDKTHFDKVQKEKDKFEKSEKNEKFEIKEFDKVIHDVKFLETLPGVPVGPGPVEDRLAALEATVAQLMHFIPENLRPDLSKGALRQEPDAGKPDAATPPASETDASKSEKKK
jgi:hypothetical protein